MKLHAIQEKLLKIASRINLEKMSLREIAYMVEESHPQKVRHHLGQLVKKGFIEINKKTGEVSKVNPEMKTGKNDVIDVPIYGSANCGEADIFAQENLEGYLKVSKTLIGKVKNIFAIRAQGVSMNLAKVNGRYSIEEGDYVLVDPNDKKPQNGDYILSVINGCANIKKFFWDKKNNQIMLASESSENFPPIFIHEDDDYMVNGIVKNVMKNSFARDWEEMQNASGRDILKELGPISKEEADYYANL
jgi:SOS-response transcriptional repressor LexA